MVKRLCLSSTVEVAVSPDALSLCPALSPPSSLSLYLYLTCTFLLPHTPSASLRFSLTTSSHSAHTAPTSPIPPFLPSYLFLQGLFLAIFFLLLTIFASLKGKTPSPSSQQVLPPSNPEIVSLLPVWWCNVDIIPKDFIDFSQGHEKAVYGQCLCFTKVTACGETRAEAFLDIVACLLGTTERREDK